jgi:hypothetical protein
VLVEPKAHGVAVHYRLAPDRGTEVWRLVRGLVPQDHSRFHLIPAREAVEIGPRAASKGHAVERLMAQAPFRGRRPIFVGDDFTDEAGMEAARRFGGEGLRVAEVFGGEPAAVRAWLARGVELLSNRVAPRRSGFRHRGQYVTTREPRVVGNEARRLALSWNAGLSEHREREGVHSFAPPTCGTALHWPGRIAKRADLDRLLRPSCTRRSAC